MSLALWLNKVGADVDSAGLLANKKKPEKIMVEGDSSFIKWTTIQYS